MNAKNVSIGCYKGNPTITLGGNNKFPFTFGVAKAKLVLENVDSIKKFVEMYETPKVLTAQPVTVNN